MTAQPRDRNASRVQLALEPLCGRRAWISVTAFLIASNLLVAGAMLISGAGLWHSSNTVQMA